MSISQPYTQSSPVPVFRKDFKNIKKIFQHWNLATLTLNNLLKQLERKLVVPPGTITYFFEPVISWRNMRITTKGTTTVTMREDDSLRTKGFLNKYDCQHWQRPPLLSLFKEWEQEGQIWGWPMKGGYQRRQWFCENRKTTHHPSKSFSPITRKEKIRRTTHQKKRAKEENNPSREEKRAEEENNPPRDGHLHSPKPWPL